MRTELTRLNWFDFALSFMAASLAVYTAGMGLGVGEISWTFIGLLAIGSTFSLGIHYLVRDSWVSRLDGVFFTLGGVASLIWVQQLNAMLPEGGFPRAAGDAAELQSLSDWVGFGPLTRKRLAEAAGLPA